MKHLKNLTKQLNYNFQNQSLLELAITHPSFSQTKTHNYERLEFFGDKILGTIIADYLLVNFPFAHEGELSKKQAYLVSGDALLIIAKKLNLPKILKIGNGEKKMGGQHNQNNLASAVEAIIASIYLDSDFLQTKNIVLNLWQDLLSNDDLLEDNQDFVSTVQEFTQNYNKSLPFYQFMQINNSQHQPIFEAKLDISGLNWQFIACGNSKKEARKNVAKKAVDFIKKNQ
jgi:ribonuclease-3